MGGNKTSIKPGQIKNPGGRPKGSTNKFKIKDIQDALKKAQAKHGGVSFLEHIADKAYKDNALAICILRKLLPDLRHVDASIVLPGSGDWANLTPQETLAAMVKTTVGTKTDDK